MAVLLAVGPRGQAAVTGSTNLNPESIGGKKRLYLVDVSSMFFRAFYAIRPLSSPSGLPVNAIYGFITMCLKLLKEEKPEAIVFCFDRPEPSFRKEIDPNYKANRSEMPEDLVPQIPYIKKVGPLLGIACVDVPQFEADDVIGTLAVQGWAQGFEVVIVSGDKDFAQLLRPGIVMLDTMKESRTGPAEAVEKWGVRPDQMIDYLALVGDSSDNVPGVAGIGPKGAQKLLQEFDSLAKIYENVDSIKGATKEKLVKSQENAFLSQKLVTIVTDVPIHLDWQAFHLQAVDSAGLDELLRDLNFKNLQRSILELPNYPKAEGPSSSPVAAVETGPTPGPQSATPSTPLSSLPNFAPGAGVRPRALSKDVTETPEFNESNGRSEVRPSAMTAVTPGDEKASPDTVVWVEPRRSAEAIQVEDLHLEEWSEAAWSLRLEKDGPGLWFFQHGEGLEHGFYVALRGAHVLYRLIGDLQEWGRNFSRLNQIEWLGFDVKSLAHVLGLDSLRVGNDVQVAAYALFPGEASDFPLVVSRVLREAFPETVSATEYFVWIEAVAATLSQRLDEAQKKIYQELDLPLVPILYAMEKRGVLLDVVRLKEQSAGLASDIARAEKQIHALAGSEFNVASPKQLATVLFETLKLPPQKKTKTGYSTDTEVLEKLKPLHPIASEVLIYRELSKLKSTYVDALPEMVDEKGRLHTTFTQTLTTTGRLSSHDPNLQNIPIRTPRGAEVRKAFIAGPGMELLSIDYSQIELRILAHYSEDKNLIQAFWDDLDIHAATASEIFSIPLKEVTSDQRRTAKAVNFGIAYGQGAFGLAENLGISRGEAQEIIQRYFNRFPGVGAYIESTIAQAKADGFVSTLFGRRRYMTELQSHNQAERKFGERAAINAPIQGTAADIVRKAMIEVAQVATVPMILQVHDELIFEAARETLIHETPLIKKTMEQVYQLRVPLKVNSAQGPNWDEAH